MTDREPLTLLRELHDAIRRDLLSGGLKAERPSGSEAHDTAFETCPLCADLREALTNADAIDRRGIAHDAAVYATCYEEVARRLLAMDLGDSGVHPTAESLASGAATLFIQRARGNGRWR